MRVKYIYLKLVHSSRNHFQAVFSFTNFCLRKDVLAKWFGCLLGRMLEDYAVLYFGSAMFKIGRLLVIAMMCVHIFACVFYRVKKESAASPDDVAAFYVSKAVDPNVSAVILCGPQYHNYSYHLIWAMLQSLPSREHDAMTCCDFGVSV
jgi:hypothetical protein